MPRPMFRIVHRRTSNVFNGKEWNTACLTTSAKFLFWVILLVPMPGDAYSMCFLCNESLERKRERERKKERWWDDTLDRLCSVLSLEFDTWWRPGVWSVAPWTIRNWSVSRCDACLFFVFFCSRHVSWHSLKSCWCNRGNDELCYGMQGAVTTHFKNYRPSYWIYLSLTSVGATSTVSRPYSLGNIPMCWLLKYVTCHSHCHDLTGTIFVNGLRLCSIHTKHSLYITHARTLSLPLPLTSNDIYHLFVISGGGEGPHVTWINRY